MPPSPESPHVPAEREIFAAAAVLPEEERAAYLDLVCEGRPDVRGRVEAWLGEHESNAFMETVVEANRVDPGQAGERIGNYKLLQQIGEGGFGTVWMAEQVEPVSRRVALKVIKPGMDTREVIARFEQERQALAMMDHPNIAKVHDAGATQSGRPFFVMELVKGVPITQYCDEAGLGTRERLELFGDVCSAINHAHQKGVIHRDIKPSNVMVTLYAEKPVVKVIDFGIAKATQSKLTDKTLFTRFEQFIGTPVYMSPEQAAVSAVDIDTRSDIYALGVLLYELLTGKPPFDAKSLASAGYEEMRRIIREVEPPKPSSRLITMKGEERTSFAKSRRIEPDKLHRLVEPDLDWIVMKAIEKDRARRYETANGLAQDIQRFLADEPVSATPPTAAYKFRKFARRNKAALRVATGITALLIAATAVSIGLAIRATRAEKLAEGRLEDAEAISKFLTTVFESADPGRGGGGAVTVADSLKLAAKKLETDLADQPGRRAKLQAALATASRGLGRAADAIPLGEKVRDYYLTTLGREDSVTLWAEQELARSYHAAGRLSDALSLRDEVLRLSQRVNGPEHSDTLLVQGDLAASYHATGRREEALKLQEKVLEFTLKTKGLNDLHTLGQMTGLAIYYDDAGRGTEATKLREDVLDLSRNLIGRTHPQTIASMTNLAISYDNAGRREEALKMREEVVELSREANGKEHYATIAAMGNLALSYSDAKRHEEALQLQENVMNLSISVNGDDHPSTIFAISNMALYSSAAGHHGKAVELGEKALDLRRRVSTPKHHDTVGAMEDLGKIYANAGRGEDALKLREKTMPLSQEVNGLEHPDTLKAMNSLAFSLFNNGRRPEALTMREDVLKLRRKVLTDKHPDTIRAMTNLEDSYDDVGRVADSLKLQEEVLTLCREVYGPKHFETLRAMTNLTAYYDEVGKLNEAIALQEEAIGIMRRELPADAPLLKFSLDLLAKIYDKAGRTGEVRTAPKEAAPKNPPPKEAAPVPAAKDIKALEKALEDLRQSKDAKPADKVAAMTELTAAYGADGRGSKAIKLGEEALALARALPAGDVRTRNAMKVLVPVYKSFDLDEKAAELEKELQALPDPVPGPE